MPGRDGTGPMGPRGCGMGRRGRRNAGGGFGECNRRGMGRGATPSFMLQDEKAVLASRAEMLRAELANVEKRLTERDSQ